jgi:hypothetical protein
VVINGSSLVALLDSGSTHNFVDAEVVAHAGISLRGRAGLRVAVANGERLTSPGSCQNLRICIEGELFDIDCYGLTLGSFDMVLGIQWLESLGPILWDLGSRTVGEVPDAPNHVVCGAAVKVPSLELVVIATVVKESLRSRLVNVEQG